ncbi:MAG: hypothetical protein K2N94_12815 [Lachnospiraceae bacterium]|nr:hypothetical protein [Lachnospiraceae bacterium]
MSMKSDEEFIAGIYEKAEASRKKSETCQKTPGTDAREREKTRRFRPRAVRWLAAAACVGIISCVALAAGRKAGTKDDFGEDPANHALLPASLNGEENSRMRSVEMLETVRGRVTACVLSEDAAILTVTDEETAEELSVMLQCGVKPEEGEDVILLVNAEQDGYYLTDASRYYRRGNDGLYYNAQGSIFLESTEGE